MRNKLINMKIVKSIAYLSAILVMTGKFSAQDIDSSYEVAVWPEFKSGAVSFTFDDNTPNQISVALPIFNEYDFKMTFFTVINWGPNWTALNSAAQNGHEIGSHTVTHSIFSSLSDSQQEEELKNSYDAINSHVADQNGFTIAYPYCVTGNSDLCRKYYIAARGCSGIIESKSPSDFMNISSFVCGTQGSIQRAGDFSNKADQAASRNGWVVFLIHALDDESGYSPTSSSELKDALDYLNRNDSKFWVATFGNVARYIKERDNVSIKQNSETDTLISFTAADTLDNSIYNYPLTVRRVLPEGWISAYVTQNGEALDSRIESIDGSFYLEFNIIPDNGEIQIVKNEATGTTGSLNKNSRKTDLLQNYPNPFNPVTTINYKLFESGSVSLKVYDLLGREITALVNEDKLPGNYYAKFDGSNLSSGLYIYKLDTYNFSGTRKLLLLK